MGVYDRVLKWQELAKSQYWVLVLWGKKYPWYIGYGIYTLVPYWVRAELQPFLYFTPEIRQFWAISKMAVNQLIFRISTADFSIIHVYTYPMRDHSQFWDFQKFYFGRPLEPWFSYFQNFDHAHRPGHQNDAHFWTSHILSYILAFFSRDALQLLIITFYKYWNKILAFVAFGWKSRPT